MQQEITDQREWLDRLEIGVVDGSETEEILALRPRRRGSSPRLPDTAEIPPPEEAH